MIGIDNKGQISAEYLLLIVVLILVMGTFTIPLVQTSVDASNDMSQASDANIAVDSIVSAVNIVYSNGPGSTRQVDFYIPDDMTLNANGYTITLSMALSNGTHVVNSSTNNKMNTINNLALSQGWYQANITWTRNSNINVVIGPKP